jgi:hypothetical protein
MKALADQNEHAIPFSVGAYAWLNGALRPRELGLQVGVSAMAVPSYAGRAKTNRSAALRPDLPPPTATVTCSDPARHRSNRSSKT